MEKKDLFFLLISVFLGVEFKSEIRFFSDASSPLQCKKCYFFGHATTKCRNSAICKICSSKEHTEDQCVTLSPKCNNCKQQHHANDKHCSSYIKELEICTLQADLGISFADARDLHKEQSIDNGNNTIASQTHNSPPNISSRSDFPPIRNKITIPSSQLNRQIINHKPPNVSAKQHPTTDTNSSNLANSQISQESSWFPQQQNINRTISSQAMCPSQLSLPPLSPQHCPAQNNQQNNYNQSLHNYESSSKKNNYESNHEYADQINSSTVTNQPPNPSLQSLTAIFHKLLPLLINIIFSNTISDKIESIINIGQILHAEDLVSSTLTSLNLTSALSQ